MSSATGKFRKMPRFLARKLRGKAQEKAARVRELEIAIVALRRALDQNLSSVVQLDGRRVAIVPLLDHPRLERFLEQEEAEKELDRLDVEEAERRLADPYDATIPYEQVRRELGLARLSD